MRQPEWDDVETYSAEWYRRFRAWHHETYPDSDPVTKANLDDNVRRAEEEEARRRVVSVVFKHEGEDSEGSYGPVWLVSADGRRVHADPESPWKTWREARLIAGKYDVDLEEV